MKLNWRRIMKRVLWAVKLIIITEVLGFTLYTYGLAVAVSIQLQVLSWFFIAVTLFVVGITGLAVKYYYIPLMKKKNE